MPRNPYRVKWTREQWASRGVCGKWRCAVSAEVPAWDGPWEWSVTYEGRDVAHGTRVQSVGTGERFCEEVVMWMAMEMADPFVEVADA